MKVVLDTNVFISGIFWRGPPYKILNAWRFGKLHPIVFAEILNEYYRVALELSNQFPEIEIITWIELMSINSISVEIPGEYNPICRDPDDDKFIHAALVGKAKTVISGDKHLLDVNGYQGIEIIKPKTFVEKYLTLVK